MMYSLKNGNVSTEELFSKAKNYVKVILKENDTAKFGETDNFYMAFSVGHDMLRIWPKGQKDWVFIIEGKDIIINPPSDKNLAADKHFFEKIINEAYSFLNSIEGLNEYFN